jgi:hypothetical protein
MASAMETFTDSYLKKLKRPELQGNFNPDQNYGANMVSRSNEVNPWIGRDQDNAKYGYLGGTPGVNKAAPGSIQTPTATQAGTSTQGSNLFAGLSLPAGTNIPGLPSKQRDTFNSLMTPVAGSMGNYAAKNIMEWIRPSKFESLSPMMEGYAQKVMGMAPETVSNALSGLSGDIGANVLSSTDAIMNGAPDIATTLASQFGKEAIDVTESGLGGYSSLLGNAVGESTKDLMAPTFMEGIGSGLSNMGPGIAAAAIPVLGRMFGLKGDAANGLGAATGVGLAAAQGGLNPISDIGAVYSLFKLFRGLFS